MGLFRKRVVAYNISENSKRTILGFVRYGKIKIRGYHQGIVPPDPEDLIVMNIPWDIIQTLFLELPPVKKTNDMIRAAEYEVRRATGIEEDITVGCVCPYFGKSFVVFVKNSDFKRFLDLNNINFVPDVSYPNILAELLLIKKLPGYWVYIVIGETSSGIVVMNGNSILNMRMLDITVNEVSHIVKEETGFELYEIESSGNEELLESARKIVEAISDDIIGILEREITISVNTTEIEKITLDKITGFSILCDSSIVKSLAVHSQSETIKYVEPVFNIHPKSPIRLSEYGLLYRGGIELGKVKSITW
ncbi:hypothetical protein MNL76_02465 [Fervidobacterium riparium]|nr:hypothetical protein IB67_03195 [Fervidobacterium riparium]